MLLENLGVCHILWGLEVTSEHGSFPRGWPLGEVQACLTGLYVSLFASLGTEVEPALGSLKCLNLKFSEVFGNVLKIIL